MKLNCGNPNLNIIIDKPHCRAYVITNFGHVSVEEYKKIKEIIMVEVTESATQQIAEYFKDKEVSPIRIFLNAGG